jgi:CheY-like chemotaxis protein
LVNKSVLVVDDEDLVRWTAVEIFRDFGLTVFEAGTGADALSILREHSDISLLFSDCRMPGMSGQDLVRKAGEQYPLLKIVLVSGYTDINLPDWLFLRKPYQVAELADIAAGLLQV